MSDYEVIGLQSDFWHTYLYIVIVPHKMLDRRECQIAEVSLDI